MKSFVLALFAIVALSSVSFGQDCSSGTCPRPVKEVVQKASVIVATPVKHVVHTTAKVADTVSTQRPVRRFFRKLRCR
jgi:hypothetical protein